MMRGFTVLVSALAALSAQAQDARTTKGAAKASNKPADCSVVDTYLAGGAPAVRTRQTSLAEREGTQIKIWAQSPYVNSITRCGRLYIFQLWSRTKEGWIVDGAGLDGPKGEVLRTTPLRFKPLQDG